MSYETFSILHDSPPVLSWIEDVTVADRLIEVWPKSSKSWIFGKNFQKSKQPSNKSYNTLKAAVLDELVIAKLDFFSYLAGMFKSFHIKQIVQWYNFCMVICLTSWRIYFQLSLNQVLWINVKQHWNWKK